MLLCAPLHAVAPALPWSPIPAAAQQRLSSQLPALRPVLRGGFRPCARSDHDVRLPFYVRGPGVPNGVKLDHLVGNVDFAPTWLVRLKGGGGVGGGFALRVSTWWRDCCPCARREQHVSPPQQAQQAPGQQQQQAQHNSRQ